MLKNTIQDKPRQLALIIPGHNEALVIQDTIRSALASGQNRDDIFVVDDNSNDGTADLAREILSVTNVLSVPRSGKARAIMQALEHFKIADSYQWAHIADADSVFGPAYFAEFTKNLNPDKYVAATGYVKALKGNWISKYRAYEYSLGQEIMRRIQSMLGTIPVIPGPTSCFRTDVLEHLDFTTPNITEDFDITLQLHRNKLGKIQYIPSAVTWTQDPKDYRDYVKQVSRWYRGFWQGIMQRRVGLGFQRIDAYLGYQMIEMFIYYLNLMVLLPILLIQGHGVYSLAITFLIDCVIFFATTIMAAMAHKRLDVLEAFPLFYILRLTNMVIYLKEFMEVVILRRHRLSYTPWDTEGRRYRMPGGATEGGTE